MPQTANDDLLLPQRPRLVLRLGFAGRRDLGDQAALDRALDRVFASIGQCLAGLAPAASPTVHPRPKIADFYDQQLPPLLRLITGLSEGADTAAALALERMPALSGTTAADIDSARPASKTALETELAAVLPFDVASYRASRYGWFQAEFDRQAALCRYIVELDGIHARPEPDTDLARARRNKGYRAQSAVLLRQADLLVAAADPRQPGKAGGTLETVRAALSFGLPVIFIDTSDAAIRVVHPEDDLASVLSMPPPTDAQLDQRIDALVMQLVADPDLDANSDDATRLALLHEFFDSDTIPPAVRAMRATDRWRLRGWDYLKSRLESWPQTRRQGNDDRPPAPAPESSSPAEPQELDHRMDDRFAPTASPYHPWRDRAGRLNHHYGGLYRGAFVLGYGLALMAVLLASLSLVLLGMLQSDSAQSPERTVSERAQALASAPADPASLATPTSEPASHESTPLLPAWLVPSLVLLGLGKLGIVWFLARNTQRANDEQWSDLAVNYRYLAERLRAMYYLPLAASFQPPAAVSAQYASRGASQSAVDWLFNANAR
ncbi:MAG TPA: hypothetical protein DIW77_07725, partial [Chromatiaceae bacterium]|nr:hypothetical protein [Chromatiaceae bacterium]